MPSKALTRADLITGLVFLALGLAVAVESYNMPRLEERSINPWTIPGLVPGFLGLIIAALGAALLLRSVYAVAAPEEVTDVIDAADARAGQIRFYLCLGLCLVYALLLVGHTPFWFATGIFVFAFVAAFEWRSEDTARSRLIKLAIAAALAVATAVAVSFLFETLFLVRLP